MRRLDGILMATFTAAAVWGDEKTTSEIAQLVLAPLGIKRPEKDWDALEATVSNLPGLTDEARVEALKKLTELKQKKDAARTG